MKMTRMIVNFGWILVALFLAPGMSVCQPSIAHESFALPVNQQTVVRFFYLPANDYLHPALIFRVAGPKSGELNTAPITNRGGRTPYISIEEMRTLVHMLNRESLSWSETKTVEVPGPVGFQETTGMLQIKIFSSGGTASSDSAPSKLCNILAPLDEALKQPRALWEFQLFRVDYGCAVPGFDRKAFPDHDEGDR
jgi:hypothetical protein